MSAVVQWVNAHYWGPSWPNMFAPNLLTLPAVVITHVRAQRQRERQHEDIKQHVTKTVGGADGNGD